MWRGGPGGDAYRVPAASLLATLRDPRFLIFVGVWFGLNALFGLGSVPIGGEQGQEIAWQAHIGGFVAGFFLFSAFDPVGGQSEIRRPAKRLARRNIRPTVHAAAAFRRYIV